MNLLISDYDGTFYTDEHNIRLNCEAIESFIRDGNMFVLSSGRSLKSLMGKVEEYKIPFNFLSCCDGSFLFDKNHSMHFAYTLSHDVRNIIAPLIDLGKHKTMEYAYPDDYSIEYDNKKILGSIAFTIERNKVDREFLNTFSRIKLNNPEYQYDTYKYQKEEFYLIRPLGVSKVSPISYLEGKYDIPRGNIFTIGDNTNDKELIRDYNGYRIGNNEDLVDVAISEYKAVHELVDDINQGKVLKRF